MKKLCIMIICVIVLCACSLGTATENESYEEPVSTSIELSINGYTVYLNPSISDIWIEPMSMAGDAPNNFIFSSFNGYSIKCRVVSETQ